MSYSRYDVRRMDAIIGVVSKAEPEHYIEVKEIQAELSDFITIEEAVHYVAEIKKHYPEVISCYMGYGHDIIPTGYTDKFIKRGGFVKEYWRHWWGKFWNIIPTWLTVGISLLALVVSFLSYYRPVDNNGENKGGDRKNQVENVSNTAGFRKALPVVYKGINDSAKNKHK